ncbi:prepilin-type N-terminal cleavage/methylation domain-containing protein [Pseudidiomarina aestuarii]|uniref:prepilin-type N-terminal cleavage/methylation domain-containing protein n=1 Tax=Pseudidiomarina aestuarii TaxID=624146 RepID=UPI003A984E18
MNSQKGFTLIELIIVIVVLGILAVTAAPQFINFGADAREGTLEKVKASMISAGDIIYGKSLIEGNETLGIDDNATVGNITDDTYPTADTYEIQFGYPAPTALGIVDGLNLSSGDWDIGYGGASKDPVGPELTDTVRISPAGRNVDDPDAAEAWRVTPGIDWDEITNCYVEYTPAASAGAQPTITITATGC